LRETCIASFSEPVSGFIAGGLTFAARLPLDRLVPAGLRLASDRHWHPANGVIVDLIGEAGKPQCRNFHGKRQIARGLQSRGRRPGLGHTTGWVPPGQRGAGPRPGPGRTRQHRGLAGAVLPAGSCWAEPRPAPGPAARHALSLRVQKKDDYSGKRRIFHFRSTRRLPDNRTNRPGLPRQRTATMIWQGIRRRPWRPAASA
jgi:hypothetical protein